MKADTARCNRKLKDLLGSGSDFRRKQTTGTPSGKGLYCLRVHRIHAGIPSRRRGGPDSRRFRVAVGRQPQSHASGMRWRLCLRRKKWKTATSRSRWEYRRDLSVKSRARSQVPCFGTSSDRRLASPKWDASEVAALREESPRGRRKVPPGGGPLPISVQDCATANLPPPTASAFIPCAKPPRGGNLGARA